jgi:hypothetical protein
LACREASLLEKSSFFMRRDYALLYGCAQRLVQVGDDVADVLDPY